MTIRYFITLFASILALAGAFWIGRNTKAASSRQAAALSLDEQRRQLGDEFKRREDAASSEPRAEPWASGEEQRIRAAVERVTPHDVVYHIDSLSCHTSLCQLVISHSNPDAQRRFITAFAQETTSFDVAGTHFTPLPPGTDKSAGPLDVLVFRQGFPMPGH